MEFTVTEEFIREAHGAACSTWKQRIEKEFPDLFKTELEVGKWYKGSVGFESLIFITEIEDSGNFNKIHHYGFFADIYCETDYIANRYHEASLIPASSEEVESALIAEAKKRGFKNGAKFNCPLNGKIKFGNITDDYFFYNDGTFTMFNSGGFIFKDGKWAEILPEQKNIITKGKALRIIAKKLKVSPESIEIQ